MSTIRVNSIKIKNYRSFGNEDQEFKFANNNKPTTIIGYNNCGKTNLMNSILYTLQINFVSRDTFTIEDFYEKAIDNKPSMELVVESSIETKYDRKQANMTGRHALYIDTDSDKKIILGSKINSATVFGKKNYDAFGAVKYYNIFYINFHKIKEEIVTQKSNWGNIKSFLGKHIQSLMEADEITKNKKDTFKNQSKNSVDEVLANSKLNKFISQIKANYCKNLRENAITVDFGLPDYEDIFLQMVFKIGIGGDINKLVPIDHFGDGYISMFIMAVIQAIAESSSEHKCLFLFEEPESFLHENHQEYFYNNVLCPLAENHQVIYTTHSHKMIDIQNAENIIRLELENGATIKKYNNIGEFKPEIISDLFTEEEEVQTAVNPIQTIDQFNNFIKIIEPNINKILFSHKVIMVEGPNDLMVYKYLIQKKVKESYLAKNQEIDSAESERYAQTYMSFKNFVIIPHHGKTTAYILARVCKHFGVDYFMINDWDFDTNFIEDLKLKNFGGKEKDCESLENWVAIRNQNSKENKPYSEKTIKSMITVNKNLLNEAKDCQIHFNIKKLETILGCTDKNKDSLKIWEHLQKITENKITQLFPESLNRFLEIE